MKASKFDKIFDEGKEDILQYCDLSKTRRATLPSTRVNVDLPQWMIEAVDREARRLGVTRQSLIKQLLAERLQPAKRRSADR